MATVFDCDWEDGSDILNSGGTYEWDSETDTGSKLSENTSSLMWDSDCLEWNGQSSAAGYLTKQLSSSQAATGLRFGLNVVSEGLTSAQYQLIFRIKDTGGNVLLDCFLYDNGSIFLVFFQVYDTGGTGRNTNGIQISTGTNYQIVCKLQKNTAGGFYFTVYAEDGTTVIGSEIQLSTDYTTRNTNAYIFYAGTIVAPWTTTNHAIDITQITDTYAYPDTIQAGGAINWITNIQGASVTPSISQTMARALSANIAGVSTTPSVASIMARGLITDIQGASVTPSISQTMSRALIADIQGGSVTPSVASIIARSLMTSITGESTTAEATVNIIRSLITNIIGSSVTPEITATLEGIISWVVSITGSSVTPEISANIARGLLINVQGQSVTPDDVAAIWNEILLVVDPSITSLTAERIITSLTPIKTIESITLVRTIEEI